MKNRENSLMTQLTNLFSYFNYIFNFTFFKEKNIMYTNLYF